MIRTLSLIIVALVFVLISAGFAWLNPERISLDLAFGVVDTPVAYAFIACFALGWLFGLLTIGVWAIRSARQRRKLARQLRLAEAEVTNLRQLPAADAG